MKKLLLSIILFCVANASNSQEKYSQEWLKANQYGLMPYDVCISTTIYYLQNDTIELLLNKKDTVIRVDSVYAVIQIWAKDDNSLDTGIIESDFNEAANSFFKKKGNRFYKYILRDKDVLDVLNTSASMNTNKELILKHPEQVIIQ